MTKLWNHGGLGSTWRWGGAAADLVRRPALGKSGYAAGVYKTHAGANGCLPFRPPPIYASMLALLLATGFRAGVATGARWGGRYDYGTESGSTRRTGLSPALWPDSRVQGHVRVLLCACGWAT